MNIQAALETVSKELQSVNKELLEKETLIKDMSSRQAEIADEAYQVAEREITTTSIKRLNHKREALRKAIRNIEMGVYGECNNCGDEIPKDRLSRQPDTEKCVECKTLEEIKQRTMRR